jgi:hypothetical protein
MIANDREKQTEFNAAMEVLQNLAIEGTAEQRRLHPKRRPTWAPAIAFSEELIEALRPFYNGCDCKFGRLWPHFSWDGKWWDKERPVRSFHLHAGLLPNGLSIVFVAKNFKPPAWSVNTFSQRDRVRDLGVAELIKFAASTEEVLVAGARVSGICYRCYKPLTDPQSRQRGIGPECFKESESRRIDPSH